MDKVSLRKILKEKRHSLNMEKLSKILRAKLVQTDEYERAKHIMIYYPLPEEVNLLPLIEDTSKSFYLPRIKGKELECCSYSSGEMLSSSCFQTKEPVCEACDKSCVDTVIVPALACDKEQYRLGYGGGYYDRFLKDFSGFKIVCLPSQFVLENIYKQPHDIRMDKIITELSFA